MAGGWRVSDDEELAALRRARRDARVLRTEAAWTHLATVVERCDRLGLFDDEDAVDDAASNA
jgi:hypothetical protein